MTLPFVIMALLTVVAAAAAMSLRNLVHCALSLVVTFVGLAGLYLQLNAQFVGLAQVLVYVGAVAILIVFAILLTRGADPERLPPAATGLGSGVLLAAAVFTVIAGAVTRGALAQKAVAAPAPGPTVKQIGDRLMTDYVLPLEVIGLLLTAAMIGAVIIAMKDKGETK